MISQLLTPALWVKGTRHPLQSWLVQAAITIGVEDATLTLDLDSCPLLAERERPALVAGTAEIQVGDFRGVITDIVAVNAYLTRITALYRDWPLTLPDPWWQRLRHFVVPVICGTGYEGGLWFRVFGWGVSIRDVRHHPSSNLRFTPQWQVRFWEVRLLRRSKDLPNNMLFPWERRPGRATK